MGSNDNGAMGAIGSVMSKPADESTQKLQWTVKGIDESVREMSRLAAKKSGMRVSSWVEMTLRNAAESSVMATGDSAAACTTDLESLVRRHEQAIRALQEDVRFQKNVIQKLLVGA